MTDEPLLNPDDVLAPKPAGLPALPDDPSRSLPEIDAGPSGLPELPDPGEVRRGEVPELEADEYRGAADGLVDQPDPKPTAGTGFVPKWLRGNEIAEIDGGVSPGTGQDSTIPPAPKPAPVQKITGNPHAQGWKPIGITASHPTRAKAEEKARLVQSGPDGGRYRFAVYQSGSKWGVAKQPNVGNATEPPPPPKAPAGPSPAPLTPDEKRQAWDDHHEAERRLREANEPQHPGGGIDDRGEAFDAADDRLGRMTRWANDRPESLAAEAARERAAARKRRAMKAVRPKEKPADPPA